MICRVPIHIILNSDLNLKCFLSCPSDFYGHLATIGEWSRNVLKKKISVPPDSPRSSPSSHPFPYPCSTWTFSFPSSSREFSSQAISRFHRLLHFQILYNTFIQDEYKFILKYLTKISSKCTKKVDKPNHLGPVIKCLYTEDAHIVETGTYYQYTIAKYYSISSFELQ